jgi:membrane protein
VNWLNLFPLIWRRLTGRGRRFRYNISELTATRFMLMLIKKIGRDDISNLAAGISFFFLLSLFPLVLGLLAILGLFLPSQTVQQQIVSFFATNFPGSLSVLQNNIPDIIRLRSVLGMVGVIGLLWSATGVFSAAANGVNRAWDIQYRHPFYIKKPLEIVMVLGCMILVLLSLATSTFLSLLGNLHITGVVAGVGTGLLGFFFSLIIFLLLHKFMPVVIVSWQYIWPGALLSAVFFEAAKTIFVYYLNHFSSYDRIYGSVASVIALLVWVYYSAYIFLLGAEFSALLFRLKREGDSFDKPPPVPKLEN